VGGANIEEYSVTALYLPVFSMARHGGIQPGTGDYERSDENCEALAFVERHYNQRFFARFFALARLSRDSFFRSSSFETVRTMRSALLMRSASVLPGTGGVRTFSRGCRLPWMANTRRNSRYTFTDGRAETQAAINAGFSEKSGGVI